MATLPTLHVGGLLSGSNSGTAITSNSGVGDDFIAAGDSKAVVFGANATGTYPVTCYYGDGITYAQHTNVFGGNPVNQTNTPQIPADLITMSTLTCTITYSITPLAGDTEVAAIQVFKSDGTTALTAKTNIVSVTATASNVTSAAVTLTSLDTTAVRSDWLNARVTLYLNHTANMGADGSVWTIDYIAFGGTYVAATGVASPSFSGSGTLSAYGPPGATLVSPASGSTAVSVTTPSLVATASTANPTGWTEHIKIIPPSPSSFGVTLAAGENDILAITSDDVYLYLGLNTNPGILARVNRDTMVEATAVTFSTGNNVITAVADDAAYVYVAFSTGGVVARVNKVTLAIDYLAVSAVTSPAAAAVDNNYLYIACGTTPAKVVRVDKVAWSTTVSTLTLSAGNDNVYDIALTPDRTILYVLTGYTTAGPGYTVQRIDLGSWSFGNTYTYGGATTPLSVCTDGSTVWVMDQSGTTLSVSPRQMNVSLSAGGSVTTSSVTSAQRLRVDNTTLWLITGETPSKVYSLPKTLAGSWTQYVMLGTGQNNAKRIVVKEGYIYVPCGDSGTAGRIAVTIPGYDAYSDTNTGFSSAAPHASGANVTYNPPDQLRPGKAYTWQVQAGF